MRLAIPAKEPVTPSQADIQLAQTLREELQGDVSMTISLQRAGKSQTITITAAEYPAL